MLVTNFFHILLAPWWLSVQLVSLINNALSQLCSSTGHMKCQFLNDYVHQVCTVLLELFVSIVVCMLTHVCTNMFPHIVHGCIHRHMYVHVSFLVESFLLPERLVHVPLHCPLCYPFPLLPISSLEFGPNHGIFSYCFS